MSGEELKACPWCGTVEHLHVSACGSMTRDMPDRPYRVVCDHIDHDQVQGPVEYGRFSAIAAWNQRAHPLPEQPQEGDRVAFLATTEESCTCLTELQDDAYSPGGPMSGKPKPPSCKLHRPGKSS